MILLKRLKENFFIFEKKIKIDHLINNAAYDVKRKNLLVLNERIKEVFEINVFAIYIIKGTLPFSKKDGKLS